MPHEPDIFAKIISLPISLIEETYGSAYAIELGNLKNQRSPLRSNPNKTVDQQVGQITINTGFIWSITQSNKTICNWQDDPVQMNRLFSPLIGQPLTKITFDAASQSLNIHIGNYKISCKENTTLSWTIYDNATQKMYYADQSEIVSANCKWKST